MELMLCQTKIDHVTHRIQMVKTSLQRLGQETDSPHLCMHLAGVSAGLNDQSIDRNATGSNICMQRFQMINCTAEVRGHHRLLQTGRR